MIEVLVAVFLVGTVLATLAAGMLSLVAITGSASDEQRLQAAVLSYTEWLRAQPYVACASASDYGSWAGHGVRGHVDDVRHWAAGPAVAWGPEPFAVGCGSDAGAQLVDLVVEFDDGRRTAEAQVVLRGRP